MKSRLISILLSVCIVFSSLSISIYATENTNNQMFKDVSPKDWFYEAVHQAVKENLFTGTSMDSFSPNSSITRGMYVTILGRIAQIDPKDSKDNFSFSDLEKGAYYVPYVMWAVEKGITQGVGGGKFAPDKILTREQMATMTLRFFDAYGITYPEKAVSTLPKDFDMISPWAQEAVMKLWSYGLFQGDEKGNFNPTKQATRAEAAAFSLRVNEKIEQYNEELAAVDELNENRYDDVVSESNSTVAYYRINFVSNGGSDTTSFLRREGGDLSNLPVPYKEGAIFGGWYYDQELTKLIGSKDLLRKDLTLYAKWMDAVPLAETENLRFASAMDQRVDFTINVLGLQSMTAQEVKDSIQVTNFNTQEEKDWIEVTKNGEEFLVSGIRYTGENGSAQNGFYEGTSYQLSLKNEQLQFDGLPQETRDYNFSIIKEDVLNLSLNNDMKFLEFSEISNIIENGVATDRINATPLAISQNGVGAGDLVEGTFTYTQGILVVGDTLAIYEGIHPSERILDDERVGADGDVAYVTITSVNGTSYGYKTADMEKVLFTPDVLPVSIEADTDGSTTNHSITVALSTFDYSDDAYGIIGLDSQTTVDIGDYISFYEGDLLGVSNEGDEPKQVSQDYAVIKTIDLQGDMYIITYDSVSLESMLATMDMYNTDPVDGDEMLENIDVAAYEEKIEQQAMDSGFVEQAGQYLAAMAIETKAFTEITEDFELRNFEILNQNGEPLSPDEIRLMEDGGMKVEVEVEQPEATLGTTLQQFEGLSGLRLTLKIEATITIGPKTPEDGDGQVEITLTGEFEEEVRIAINIDGGARWKWWAIFPYIAEYEVTANVDLLNYTGLKFHASIVTKEFSDDEWTEDEELKNVVDELKTLVDEVKEGLGSEEEEDDPANDLIEKYKAMMDTESDWVNLVEKEMGGTKKNIPPFMIIQISISFNFVIQANMNISLGAEFWYKTGKRYTYNVEIFAGKVTSDVIDLVEEQYEFTFYVMGTLGLRAGLKVEVKIALIDEKIASVGFAAEAGAYIKMYGYFYYQLTYRASQGKESKYSGALYFELGIYLELTFEAQAFAGTFSYNPTLYEKEWPLWSAGMRENIQDFAYDVDEIQEVALKKAIQTTMLPEAFFEMLYLDLKTGDSGTKIFEDSEQYFTIEMTNNKFSYDRDTNKLSVSPAAKDITIDGQMVISWINQPLAWTSKPISTSVDLHWDNLNDGYAIVFHSNGGSSLPMIIKRYGEGIEATKDPVKKGYLFEGWYEDEGLTKAYQIPETMPNVDVEVYAKWSPAQDTPYQVEHYIEVLGSGQYELAENVDLKGTTDSMVIAQTKEMEGFITPQEQQLRINADGSSKLRYYYDREIYTLTFSLGEGQGENLVSELKYGAKYTAPTLSSKGYNFVGWSPAVIENATMPAENLTYYAQWAPSADTPYRVEYYVEQISGKYTLQGIDTTKKGLTGSQVELNSLIDQQYVVEGGIRYQNTSVNGEISDAPVISKDGKLIIKVNYQRESHQAIFNPDNGEDPVAVSLKYQGLITAPHLDPTKEGYVFLGWENYEDNITMGTSDMNFTAKWAPAENVKYTVKHIREDLNGSYPQSGELLESEIRYGRTEDLTEALAKEYVGFTALAFEQVEILADGSAVVVLQYSRNSYTLDWIAEGEVYKTEQVQFGESIMEPMSHPTKVGYVFSSWSGYGEGSRMESMNRTYTATWAPATNTLYTVQHLREDINGEYTLEEIEEKYGTTEAKTAAIPKAYEGFTADENYTQVDIEADGSSRVTILYHRNRYKIHWMANGENFETTEAVPYEAEIIVPTSIPSNKLGYHFTTWMNVPLSMPASNRSFEAAWTANNYTLMYNVNGGTPLSVTSKEVTYDSTYGELPIPTYSGYQFVRWEDENGVSVSSSTLVRKAHQHQIKAIWAANDATVYQVEHYQQNVGDDNYSLYETALNYGQTDSLSEVSANAYVGFTAQVFEQENIQGDGSTVVKIYYNRNLHSLTWNIDDRTEFHEYRFGAPIIEPLATKTGYQFTGWNMAIASTMPDNALSYTATWQAEQYVITFYGNGGTTPNSKTVTYDSNYLGLPISTRTGYDFVGWFTESEGGSRVFETTKVEITADQSLYAQWTAKQYNVSFDINTGTGTTPETRLVSYLSSYSNLPENTATKTGYHFVGWFTAASGGSRVTLSTTVNSTADHVLYAQWQANTYSVIFDSNGGSGGMLNQSYTYDQSQALAINSFTKVGYRFDGWNTKADGTGIAYGNGASALNLASEGSLNLYAVWEINQYQISFQSNGGSAVSALLQDYNTAVTAPTNPVRTGYNFVSWQRNGVDYIFGTMPAENLTLIAKWATIDYTISYELDGATNSQNNPSIYNVESGNITLEEPNKTGYHFSGWYREAAYTNQVDSIAIATGEIGDRTFYAKWIPNTYTVIFNKNTGDGTADLSQSFVYDDVAKPLTANTFTRVGYTFAGWNTNADGSGTNYANQEAVRNLAQSGSLTLYAKWELVTYTISYQLNGGTQAAGLNPTSYTVSTNDILLNEASRVGGYGFMGWYDNAALTGSPITTIVKGTTGNKTFYAKWGFAGTFTVTNNGNNTFTITRNGNGVASDDQNVGQQIVYFRTVNGSAIGGTHFVHQGGNAAAVTFANGEISKTVTISEYGVTNTYNGNTATSYSNIDRSYQLELVKVLGGGLLGSTVKATRTMSKNASYTIATSIYDYKSFASHSLATATSISENINGSYTATMYTGLSGNPLTGRNDDANILNYIQLTANAMKVQLDITGADDGWRMVRHVLFNTHTNGTATGKVDASLGTLPSGTKAGFAYGLTSDANNTLTYTLRLPQHGSVIADGNNVSAFSSNGAAEMGYLRYEFAETCGISVAAYNSAGAISTWNYKGGTLYSAPLDSKEPSKIGIAPMATGDYLAGETVTIAVVFDEIVANSNGATLSGTNLMGVSYVGGVGSNVLYYSATVKNNSNQDTLLSGVVLNGSVLDMVN